MKKALLLAAAAMLLAAPAFADTSVDFSASINDPEGRPIPTCNEKTPECEKPTTLGHLAGAALFGTHPDEQKAGGISDDEKIKRADLGLKVYQGGVLSLKSEDVTLLKKVIGKAYTPLVVKRAFDLLDPAVK